MPENFQVVVSRRLPWPHQSSILSHSFGTSSSLRCRRFSSKQTHLFLRIWSKAMKSKSTEPVSRSQQVLLQRSLHNRLPSICPSASASSSWTSDIPRPACLPPRHPQSLLDGSHYRKPGAFRTRTNPSSSSTLVHRYQGRILSSISTTRGTCNVA